MLKKDGVMFLGKTKLLSGMELIYLLVNYSMNDHKTNGTSVITKFACEQPDFGSNYLFHDLGHIFL